ncbi:pirin family protein [Alkaliphilus crotonatoxidans]
MIRTIEKLITGQKTQDGAGVNLTRVISRRNVQDFDPFLLLDAFDSNNPDDYTKGFPWHPHRGIETVTYLIRGEIEHGDSLGNKGSILDGGCQWMTAGGGIMHQEMPQPSERMLGVQLWLNLPAKDKLTSPQYRDITADMIPKVTEEGVTVAVVSGRYKETQGVVLGDYVQLTLLDVDMERERHFEMEINPDETLFVYIISGDGWFDEGKENRIYQRSAALFGAGSQLVAKASENGLRFLIFSAKPLKEPIAWGGPIVMNTQEELDQAFKDIDDGNFIRHDIIKKI